MHWHDRWNPRRRLSAAVGWSVFALLALASLLAANIAASAAEQRARSDATSLLSELAAQSQQLLDARLRTRRLLLQATAGQIAASNDHSAHALRRHLEALQAQFPGFAWLGIADARGRVVVGTGGERQGEDLSAAPWFDQGRLRPRVALSQGPDAVASSIDVTAPLFGADEAVVGVVGGQLSWSWLEGLQKEMLASFGPQRQFDIVLTAADGTVLSGPPAWRGRRVDTTNDLGENGAYLVSAAPARSGDAAAPAWTEFVRQPMVTALAPARSAQHAVFGIVLLAGLLAALATFLVTQAMMRRLSGLAEQAQAVRLGRRRSLQVPAGEDEVSRIGATLAETVDHLQHEKQALTALNAELDARVAERTRRIERLAGESRDAAVTRERLRLARDLHDTLAHSLMALLTQIRLIRKLHARLDAGALDDEIARAEEVAASGLTEARAAITRMRSSGVRDEGLGAALKDLLARFAERTGLATSVEIGAGAGDLADTRAEAALRIAEESLRNVERHARATCVTLTLTAAQPSAGAAARISLVIADDGIGFDPAAPPSGHYGVQGMREQAALIEARLVVHSRPGAGTRVVLDFDAQ